jgi:hypothetical protein
MKAQILKIAGVKNEKEFYKKFPTEEAFMKKHGKDFKKAQVGAVIGASQEAPMQKPIMYDNLASNAQASVYGISPEEQARQEALAAQQAIADASGQQGDGGGLADILGGIDPAMVAQLVGGAAKNGAMLQDGGVMGSPFQGMPKTPTKFSVPSTGGFNTNTSKNPYLSGSMIGGQKAQASSGSWAANPYIKSPFKASQSVPDSNKGFDFKGLANKVAPALGGLVGDIQTIQQNKQDLKRQQMYGKVSDVVLQAASSRPEQSQRRYVTPQDQAVQNLNPLGRGTNYLAARDGAEIQNTYSPGDLYSDLGYEPLNDPNKVKQYKKGGKMKKAAGGVNLDPFSGIGGSLGGALGSKLTGGSGRGGAGSSIGSTIGGIAGSFIPIPGVGTFLGSTVGGLLGGLFDGGQQNQAQQAQDKLDQNLQAAAFQSGTQNLQMQNKAFMEDGGWVSNDWQPQVIAKFGDADVSQVHAFAQDGMPQYRAGGHLKEYTPPSAAAMYTGRRAENGVQMAMGGDLQVLDGGYAETISYNPYMPGTGETVMFRGRSHDDGGIPIQYGQNGVEVEGGEPMFQMQDGGQMGNSSESNTSGVVAGNLVIPDYGVNEIEDPKAKGKKFKHYIADLSKQEAKINKNIEKGVNLVNTKDSDDPYDQLAFNSGQAMIMGGNKKLQTIAQRKMNAAAVQNGILEAAEEHGLESDALAKGKIKYAKANDPYAEFGTKLSKAQDGKTVKYKSVKQFIETVPISKRKEIAKTYGITGYRGTASQNAKLFGLVNKQDATTQQSELSPISQQSLPANFIPGISKLPEQESFDIGKFLPKGPPKMFYVGTPEKLAEGVWDPVLRQYVAPDLDNVTVKAPKLKESPAPVEYNPFSINPQEEPVDTSKKPSWWDAATMAAISAAPFLRRSSDQPLDPATIAPEMMALANNVLEPVPAQGFAPLLSQPISISLQDQLNEVTAQTRAAERMSAYNPEAASMIAAGAYNAKNKILGEQFRMNQAEQQRVAEQNRNILNDATLKNLAIFDTQFQRQAQARSNTKAEALSAMKSVADKIAKNKLENRTLAVYENAFPAYSFTPRGVAYKNPGYLNFFNTSGGFGGSAANAKGMLPTSPIEGYEYELALKKKKESDTARNGSIVKAIKNL